MNLVRDILLAIEAHDEDPRGFMKLGIDGRSEREVSYHVMLMDEAGLIAALDLCTMGDDGFRWAPKYIRWQGHEFLNAARSDSLWKMATSAITEKAGGATLDLLFDVLTGMAKDQLGL